MRRRLLKSMRTPREQGRTRLPARKCLNTLVGSTPNYQPTRKPTGGGSGGGGGECVDDPTWSYGTKASNTCAYVARKLKRCKAKNTDGVRTALEACPLTCGTC